MVMVGRPFKEYSRTWELPFSVCKGIGAKIHGKTEKKGLISHWVNKGEA